MTEVIIVAVIVSLPPTLAAVGALIIGIVNGSKSDKIHVLVNSNLAKVQANLKLAEERVNKLEQLLAKEENNGK